MLLTCQAGFEALLGRELCELHGTAVAEQGPGWVRPAAPLAPGSLGGLTFPHLTLLAPQEVRGESVNALASAVSEYFLATLRGERIEARLMPASPNQGSSQSTRIGRESGPLSVSRLLLRTV